jgi:hypothetical protein
MRKRALPRTISPAAFLMMTLSVTFSGALSGALSGCAAVTQLNYRPTDALVQVPASPPQIAGVMATDYRKESPRRLGTDIVFNHTEAFNTTKPVKDDVARVFTQALIARHEITHDPSAPLVLVVDLFKFDAVQDTRSRARIEMTISLADRKSGQILYRDDLADQIASMPTGGSALIGLQAMAEQLLDRSVDRLLGKPGFLALAAPRTR